MNDDLLEVAAPLRLLAARAVFEQALKCAKERHARDGGPIDGVTDADIEAALVELGHVWAVIERARTRPPAAR